MKLKKLIKVLESSYDDQITLMFSRNNDIATLDLFELRKIVKDISDIGNLKVDYFCPYYATETYYNSPPINLIYFHIYVKNNGTSIGQLKELIKNWREIENNKTHYTFAD